MTDLTFESGLFRSLGRSVAAVVERVLEQQPPEQMAVLAPLLLSGEATVILSVCVSPFEVAVHCQSVDPNNTDAPLLLCEIKSGPEAVEQSYDQGN